MKFKSSHLAALGDFAKMATQSLYDPNYMNKVTDNRDVEIRVVKRAPRLKYANS